MYSSASGERFQHVTSMERVVELAKVTNKRNIPDSNAKQSKAMRSNRKQCKAAQSNATQWKAMQSDRQVRTATSEVLINTSISSSWI